MAFILSCFQSKYLPWAIASSSMNNFLHADVNEKQSALWLEGQLQQLGIVNLTVSHTIKTSYLLRSSNWD